MVRQIAGPAGIVLAAVLLAGCGGGSPKATTTAPEPVPPAERATAAPTTDPVSEFLGSTLQSEVSYTDEAGAVAFTTPAHDINCSITDAPRGVTCQLPTFSYKPAGKNKCNGNGVWGATLDLTTKAIFVCATDAVVATKPLDYGKRIEVQELICVSRQDGMTCRNSDTNHGFRVAEGYYTFF